MAYVWAKNVQPCGSLADENDLAKIRFRGSTLSALGLDHAQFTFLLLIEFGFGKILQFGRESTS